MGGGVLEPLLGTLGAPQGYKKLSVAPRGVKKYPWPPRESPKTLGGLFLRGLSHGIQSGLSFWPEYYQYYLKVLYAGIIDLMGRGKYRYMYP